MYTYRCTILKVIDGDTVDADVDLGFDIHAKMRFRLAGINAPEMNTPEGKAAREYLILMMPPESEFTVCTQKDRKEKFGRYLGTFLGSGSLSINQLMVEAGHAVEKDY
jgi:micrococcal nuclease